MLNRICRFIALAAVLLAPTAALAAPAVEKKPSDGPAILIRVQSINQLLATGKYIGTLMPEDAAEQFKQGIGFVESLIDPKKGIEGVDVKNPIGAYASLTGGVTDSPVVVLVPVADKDTLLKALKERANLDPKEKDGVFETEIPDQPMKVFFRFANDYMYATVNDAENIALKTLPNPKDVLGGSDSHLLSATLRIDRLPEQLKKMAIGFIEDKLGEAQDLGPAGNSKAIKELMQLRVTETVASVKEFIEGGEALSIRLDINPKTEEMAFEFEVGAKKGSKLAKDIAEYRDHKSLAASAVRSKDGAVGFHVYSTVTEGTKKKLPAAFDDLIEMLKKEANVPGEVLTKAEPLIKALKPTILAGEADIAAGFHGPDDKSQYTGIVAVKVADGKKIEQALKDLVKKELPPDVSGRFEFDVETVGNATLHKVKVNDVIDEKGARVLGKSDVYVLTRSDLLVVAIGPSAKDMAKAAATAKAETTEVVYASASLSRLAALMGDDAKELAATKAAAEKIFGKGGSKADTIKMVATGGDTLKFRLSAHGKAIQFIAQIGAISQKKEN